ncbi:tyrosyl-tRNA synthetase [Aurantiacibacter atlanticus]|uniref:Tyrosine--tRNA ligase n=1 Tax=Aurantiacibacter atlanticus TaxID=1648404 RepID=A0A0H4W1H0_9SPHN|nr:tyrosine--tRNA ligase [Aurantiacibacter atlanticus]AKQ43358.1 tyrosyl-tRNA synthetase [Aurantiacibacter atlanticus]MDF1833695.1 tyrosine--tRNA ligase [Alteraurantiacibacter sp. bin_em_oilr2.035]
MTTFKSDLLQLLHERGHVHQLTDSSGLDALAARQTVTAYVGFDPTAASLHIGNLASIMLLRRVQQAGHRPIVVMGGGTAKIGDPSGKDETRQMMTDERLASNIASIKGSFERMLQFGDGPKDALLVNNDDWLSKLGYIEMLRDVGPHFTVNRMLTFDSVKLRLDREQPLTFLEFNYMILQAYDFLKLARDYDCTLQLGGSDQWGNIVNGIELGRRIDGRELYGVTAPLITRADGSKMGKSVTGAVWLNEDALPAYDFWQYWRNTDDRDVGRFLRLFTDLDRVEIARLESLEGSEINHAKAVLADEVTKLVRGSEAAASARATAEQTFAGGGLGDDLPVLAIPAEGMRVGAALTALGFTASNGEAKRKIAEGAVKLDDQPVSDAGFMIAPPAQGQDIRISIGKKRHAILRPA